MASFGKLTTFEFAVILIFIWAAFGLNFQACVADDQGRIIMWKEPIPNKALEDHVIRHEDVLNEGSCRVMCYMEPNCVSVNMGPLEAGKHKCELNDATAEQQNYTYPLKNMPGYTYLAIENTCSSKPCLNNGVCQVGFSRQRFRCLCRAGFIGEKCELQEVKNCQELKTFGKNTDGIYDINPDGQGTISVFCDQTTDGGGWTVVQRRISPYNANFDQLWIGYQNGFGDLSGEFWLGNDNLHRIAASASVLRVDLTAESGQKGYAKYGGFTVGDAVAKFRCDMNTYDGNIGNGIYGHSHSWHNIRGMKFSTKDEDNDNNPNGPCVYNAGWWVNWCGKVNLNNNRNGPVWNDWATIVFTEMKIRKN